VKSSIWVTCINNKYLCSWMTLLLPVVKNLPHSFNGMFHFNSDIQDDYVTRQSLSAQPLLSVAMSSLPVLASFFQVVSISVPLWGCCLWAFLGRVLAISVVGISFRGQHCCNPSSYRVPRWKFYLSRIFGRSFSNIHFGTHWSLPCPL